MLFSTYRWVTVIFYVVALGLISLVVATYSVSDGILFVVLFSVIGLIGFWVHFSLIENRLEDYDGRIPMPNGGLGLLGIDIVDDDAEDDLRAGDSDTTSDFDDNELDSQVALPKCPYCSATLPKRDARFCDECGKPLGVRPTPEPP